MASNCSVVRVPVSIADYLNQSYAQGEPDGPQTDGESTEDDDPSPGPTQVQASRNTQLPATAPSSDSQVTKVQKGKQRWASRRKAKRMREWDEAGPNSVVKAVVKRRCTEATKNALQVPISIFNMRASKPGWLGKRASNLPSQAHTLEEVMRDGELMKLPWDGR